VAVRLNSNLPAEALPVDLSEFVSQHDEAKFGAGGLTGLRRLSKIEIVNRFQSIHELEEHITQLNILDEDQLRPRWDSYFMVCFLLQIAIAKPLSDYPPDACLSGSSKVELYEEKSRCHFSP
jgi:hypothetical protein